MKIDSSGTFQILDSNLPNASLEKGPFAHETKNDIPTDQVSVQYRRSAFPDTKAISPEDVQQAMDNFKALATTANLDQVHSNLNIDRVMRLLQPKV